MKYFAPSRRKRKSIYKVLKCCYREGYENTKDRKNKKQGCTKKNSKGKERYDET